MLGANMIKDECQIYKEHSTAALSCLRHMRFNILRTELTKLSIVGKRKLDMINTTILGHYYALVLVMC